MNDYHKFNKKLFDFPIKVINIFNDLFDKCMKTTRDKEDYLHNYGELVLVTLILLGLGLLSLLFASLLFALLIIIIVFFIIIFPIGNIMVTLNYFFIKIPSSKYKSYKLEKIIKEQRERQDKKIKEWAYCQAKCSKDVLNIIDEYVGNGKDKFLKIYCSTDKKWEYFWADPDIVIKECPIDPAHKVNRKAKIFEEFDTIIEIHRGFQ